MKWEVLNLARARQPSSPRRGRCAGPRLRPRTRPSLSAPAQFLVSFRIQHYTCSAGWGLHVWCWMGTLTLMMISKRRPIWLVSFWTSEEMEARGTRVFKNKHPLSPYTLTDRHRCMRHARHARWRRSLEPRITCAAPSLQPRSDPSL
jgi:hypothetical protein